MLRPQIVTTEKVLTSFVATAGERTCAMIGSAIWGAIDTVTSITNLSFFISQFGDDKTGTGVTGIKGADLFFRNGGTMKFIRVEDGDAAKSDYMTLNGVTNVINIEGKYKGTYGNNVAIVITANAITSANRDIQITDGKIIEVYNANGAGYATNDAITAAINASSTLAVATVESGQGTINIADAISETYLTGGDDGEDSLVSADYTTAMDDLLLTEEYNFLLIPGMSDNAFHISVIGKLDTRATTEKKYSRFITGIAKDETVATAVARTSTGKRGTVVSPNVKYDHRVDTDDIVLDGSYLACAYAGLLCQSHSGISGTHKTVSVLGLSILESTGKEYYSKDEQELLLQGSVLPIAKIGTQIQCVRGITRISDTTDVFYDEVVVDIVDYVRTECEDYLNTTIGLPNTTERRSIWAARVDAVLANAQRQEIIQEFLPSTLTEGVSPDTYIATVSITPAYAVNFIQFEININ